MSTTVHQLKVTLRGTKPPVWRRVLIRSDATLADLHTVIQAAMGWEGSHLHEFEIGGVRYGVDDDDLEPAEDEGRVRLHEVAPARARFDYLYDFGDDWTHKVVVENITSAEPGASYPVCVAGQRACPPEDCGGVFGYEHLLTALADPEHEAHETMLRWVGGSFDPEAFDPIDFSLRLEAVLPSRGESPGRRST